jgi:hypothetical protein
MIQQIINNGTYKFQGNVSDFKRCISSFKIIKVIQDGECLGIKFFEAIGQFKYHRIIYTIQLSKSLANEDVLFIKCLGGNE